MSEDLKHDEIIAEAREKYTVHHCGECEFRKSCINKFDSDECKNTRQSIMLGFGIEDGYFTNLLNRLEAAYKREQVTQCNHFNGVKVYEALKYLRDASREFHHLILNSKHNEICDKYKYAPAAIIRDAIATANAALAEPPRNCDVGTEREQSKRFDAYCHATYEHGCGDCPLLDSVCCEFAWGQLPYEAKEGDAK